MAATKIDHVAVAVSDLDAAIATYRQLLGKEPDGIEDVASQKVRVAFFRVGESRIELVCPTSDDSPVAKAIAKRGEGLHHICLGVPATDDEVRRLEEGGATIAVRPTEGAGGCRVAFVHPKSAGGVLVELSSGGTH